MIEYSELESEGSLLKPQPTIREITNSTCGRCNTSHFKIFLIFLGFVGLVLFLGHSMGLQTSIIEEVITIKDDEIIHNTSEKFLSVALDASVIQERWLHLNLSNPKLVQHTKLFSPGFLRVGGTAADRLIFNENSSEESVKKANDEAEHMDGDQWAYEENDIKSPITNFTMTGDDWVRINNFAVKTGLSLLFNLNVLLRYDNKWDDTNAKELLRFSDKHGFDISWQLGNEPNAFPHIFHTHIPGKQLGLDFVSLRTLLQTYPRYANSSLVGPDITRPKFIADPSIKYLSEFLKSGHKAVNAVTWHQYYLNGREAYVADFINPHFLNLLYKQILAVKLAVSDVFNGTDKIPIWLSETGSAYGGGAPNLSNRFIASFMWLDKLGIAAQMGIDVVIRQSLCHGYYGLLDINTFEPNPDWWVSFLYKMLVSHKVLQTSSYTGAVRFYCHCTPANVTQTTEGTVTLFGMNMVEEPVNIIVKGLPAPVQHSQISAYILTGEKNNKLSKNVLLNGKELKLLNDGSLPPLEPKQLAYSETIEMPPYSIGFFVMNGIFVPVCKEYE